jgi:hypothetical protein
MVFRFTPVTVSARGPGSFREMRQDLPSICLTTAVGVPKSVHRGRVINFFRRAVTGIRTHTHTHTHTHISR